MLTAHRTLDMKAMCKLRVYGWCGPSGAEADMRGAGGIIHYQANQKNFNSHQNMNNWRVFRVTNTPSTHAANTGIRKYIWSLNVLFYSVHIQ